MAHVIEAAGGIPYRWRAGSEGRMKDPDDGAIPSATDNHAALDDLEVCVVHRPRYGDWSWPKGKLETNETRIHAAVREMGEETGTPISLGPRIGEVEYPLTSEGDASAKTHGSGEYTKHVVYWMGRAMRRQDAHRRSMALGPVMPADSEEIDRTVWVSVRRARRLLSHALDRQMLDSFVDRVDEGALNGAVLVIVRHGKAEPRKQWRGKECDRPVTPRGAACAYALSREIACYDPAYLISSPWLRCVETLQTLAWQTKLPVMRAEELTEDGFAEDSERTWKRFDSELASTLALRQTRVLCTHRPVLGGIFGHLRTMCVSKQLAGQLVAKSPYMPTGTAAALHVIATPDGPHIIDIQRLAPRVY
jgi:8-oxo-dGTP diphosphatase